MSKSILTIEMKPQDRRRLDQLLRDLAPAQIFALFKELFDQLGSRAAGFIVKNYLSGQLLKVRTGSLRRSLTGRAVSLHGVPALRVGIFRGPTVAYAGVQEFGTRGVNPSSPYPDIVPRRAKALAIPLDKEHGGSGRALTPAGVARYVSPRDYPTPLRFIPFRRSGVAVGALYDPEDLPDHGPVDLGAARATYLLLRRVRITPKHYLWRGLQFFLPEIAKGVHDTLKGVFDGKRSATRR